MTSTSMRALFLLLLLALPSLAESLSFKPGEVTTTVKGMLVADQTKEYSFAGKAGQQFELVTRSERGQWLLLTVRDKNRKELFNNFNSGELRARGVLPEDGDYTVHLALRRAEVQREGRAPYQLTLTLHTLPELLPMAGGEGEYVSPVHSGGRPIKRLSVGLSQGDQLQLKVELSDGETFLLAGRWKRHTDEAALLQLSEAFGQPARGQGVLLFDDEIVEDGKPLYLMLQFQREGQGGLHGLTFGDDD
jgi:hypothetical protein